MSITNWSDKAVEKEKKENAANIRLDVVQTKNPDIVFISTKEYMSYDKIFFNVKTKQAWISRGWKSE